MSRPFGTLTAVLAPGRRRAAFALVAVSSLFACDVPTFEGPQIQQPPRGFLLVPDSYQQRRLFPERELVFHVGWVESMEDFSTIYVDGHRGALGFDDVVAAREEARLLADDPDVRFSEVETLRVDGREAWGWSERIETPTRGLVWVAYRAVVPYDTVSYAIEFFSGEPAIKREAPDTLKAIISTFAVGKTTYNLPLIAIIVGLVLFALSVAQSRRRASATRARSINLVKVAKKKDPEAPSGAPAVVGGPETPAAGAEAVAPARRSGPPPAPATPESTGPAPVSPPAVPRGTPASGPAARPGGPGQRKA
jgi:hypothetical protein